MTAGRSSAVMSLEVRMIMGQRHQNKKTFDLSVRGFFNQFNKPLLAQLQNLGKNKLFVTVQDVVLLEQIQLSFTCCLW